MWECTFLFNYDNEEVLTDTYVLYLCLCKRLSAEVKLRCFEIIRVTYNVHSMVNM